MVLTKLNNKYASNNGNSDSLKCRNFIQQRRNVRSDLQPTTHRPNRKSLLPLKGFISRHKIFSIRWASSIPQVLNLLQTTCTETLSFHQKIDRISHGKRSLLVQTSEIWANQRPGESYQNSVQVHRIIQKSCSELGQNSISSQPDFRFVRAFHRGVTLGESRVRVFPWAIQVYPASMDLQLPLRQSSWSVSLTKHGADCRQGSR